MVMPENSIQVTSNQSLPTPLSFIPLRGSILRLWRAPSPRGYSYHMQYCTFISQPARYVAYERGKDPTASLPMTIRTDVPLRIALSCAVSKGLSVGVSYRNVLLYAPIKKIPPELVLQRDLTNNSLSTVHSSPFRRFFWRYRAIPGGCFPERGR